MVRMVKSKWLIALFLCLLIVVTGCSSTQSGSKKSSEASSQEPTRKDTLIVAQSTDAGTLDPQKQGKMPDMNILINMFDTLVTRDEKGNLAPSLATEWEAINDTTWQFKLRQGVKFHNGEPFNAEAVKFSIDRLLNPETKSPMVELNSIKEVQVVDDYTVNIITKAPDPIIPNKTVLFGGVMVPPKYIKEKGDDYFAQHPVGTGPYKFVSWSKDNQVVMEANQDYWRDAPSFKKLIIKTIPNAADMVAALKTGEIDIATDISPDTADQLKNNSDIKILSNPWIRTFYINIDCLSKTPLAKKEVRQALNYAVDVQTIIDTLLGGHGSRVSTIIPKQNFGYDPNITPYEYNLEKAKSLLAKAGYPNGFSVKIDASSLEANIIQAIAAQLENVGVKLEINLMDSRTLTSNITAKKASPLYYIGNTGWTMDAMSNFQSYIKSDRRYSRWKNAELDKLVDIEEQNVDPKIRQDAFTKAQQIIKDEALFIFLFQRDGLYGMRSDVEWSTNPTGILWMYNAKRQ